MNKIKRFSLGKLFENNKFVLAVSLVLAFAIWLGYSMYGGEQQERSIDVQVQMDSMTVPKQFNLQQFGDYSNSTVTVTIVGKKAVIGTVNADDIKVVASTLDVNTAGKHTLPLSVSIDSTKDFQILSTNTLTVEVYFDTYKEVKVAVTTDLSAEPTVPDGYELGTVILSEDKLKAHGPSTEVSKIDKILAKAEIDKQLTNTKTYKAAIVAVDQYGNEIQNIEIDNSDDFTITIPVFKLAKLPVSVEFTNMPRGISEEDLNIRYSVSNINIAGEPATIDKMESIVIGTIDFSELNNTENSFSFDVSSLAGIKVKSKISSIDVNVDLSSFKSKDISIPASKIEIVNSTALNAKITTSQLKVTIAGLTDAVEDITANDITVVLKVDEGAKTGENRQMEVSVKVNNQDNMWVIGSYKVAVDIT
ncbi:MAG: hypothetical protein E7517_03910 [Ruminococcaceae bacterium]|nr:hypothetical protein [Oscillospiraceae bacterium]